MNLVGTVAARTAPFARVLTRALQLTISQTWAELLATLLLVPVLLGVAL